MTDLVTITDQKAVTTSLTIAEVFGKNHHHVLRDIETLECSKEFNESNFGFISYVDSRNRKQPMYQITRDGFVFLAMGFTGKKAAEFKEKFILAFNAMEKALREKESSSKQVEVLHQHSRKTGAPNGLDLRYTVDLTKIINNPTEAGLAILGKLTGIDMDDVCELVAQSNVDNMMGNSLVLKFIEDCCIVGEHYQIPTGDLYTQYCEYVVKAGEFAASREVFGREIRVCCPSVTTSRPRGKDNQPTRIRVYVGIGLRGNALSSCRKGE